MFQHLGIDADDMGYVPRSRGYTVCLCLITLCEVLGGGYTGQSHLIERAPLADSRGPILPSCVWLRCRPAENAPA